MKYANMGNFCAEPQWMLFAFVLATQQAIYPKYFVYKINMIEECVPLMTAVRIFQNGRTVGSPNTQTFYGMFHRPAKKKTIF